MDFLFVFFAYFFTTTIAFQKLPQTFFQQDEWAIFGNYLYWDKAQLSWFDRLFTYEQFTHLIPLGNFFSYIQFRLFGLNFFPYGVFAIGVHLVNGMLIYYLVKQMTEKKYIAFISGIFFLTFSISHQAVTWVATTIGTAGSTFFSLIGLIFFTRFIQRNKKFSLLFSFLFFFASFLCKETGIFLFLFLPAYWFFLTPKKNNWKIFFASLTFLGTLYLLLRFLFLFIARPPAEIASEVVQPSMFVYVFRLFTAPLKILTQSILPVPYIISAGEMLLKLAYPQFVTAGVPNPYIAESVASDLVSYLLAVGILGVIFFFILFFRKKKEKKTGTVLLLSLLFVVLSALPFVLIPGNAGYFSLVEGRHLYLTNVFTAVLITIIFSGIYTAFQRKGIVLFLLICLGVFLTALHIKKIRSDLNQQVAIGITRKSILETILTHYPVLSKKTVFFIQSDKAYYGLPVDETIVPFQSGMGQTLLVWYNAHGQNLPACLLKDQFLYVLKSQGYRECTGRGFGYFRKIADLEKALKEYKLSKNSVIAFSYTSSNNRVDDITPSVRKQLP